MAKAKEAAEKAVEVVKVELLELKEGVHTVFHKLGQTQFVNGSAEVEKAVADELKALGLIK